MMQGMKNEWRRVEDAAIYVKTPAHPRGSTDHNRRIESNTAKRQARRDIANARDARKRATIVVALQRARADGVIDWHSDEALRHYVAGLTTRQVNDAMAAINKGKRK